MPNTKTNSQSSERLTACLLEKQNQKTIYPPPDKLNPKEDELLVCINGALFRVPRGRESQAPEAVADVLRQAGYC